MPKAAAAKPTKTKVRGGRKKKDPKAPKRGLSAYMFFANANRERVVSDNADATFGQIGKILGEQWKTLSDGEKQKYHDLAANDKERYEKEKAKYDAGNGGDDDEDISD